MHRGLTLYASAANKGREVVMRHLSRRAAIALVIAVTVFTVVVAFASSLAVTSSSIQAGSAVVGQACSGTIGTSYTTAGVDGGGNPLIKFVDVRVASGACTANAAPGYNVTTYLETGVAGAYTVLGSLTATGVTANTTQFTAVTAAATSAFLAPDIVQFDFSAANVKVTDLSNIAIVIS
jgi:hypothetical protein